VWGISSFREMWGTEGTVVYHNVSLTREVLEFSGK